VDSFPPFLACFLAHDMPSQRKDLREPGPIAVAYEDRTRRDITLLAAPMAQVDWPRGALPIAEGRERKDQLNIGPLEGPRGLRGLRGSGPDSRRHCRPRPP